MAEARVITSSGNPVYKDMIRLLGTQGVQKQEHALVFGRRLVPEVLALHPERVAVWISSGDRFPAPPDLPEGVVEYRLAPELFRELDIFGVRGPALVVKTPAIPRWNPDGGLDPGMTVLTPLQDPENTGALIRSAAAFGADRVVLLEESAHPFHPKALRASGGAVFQMDFRSGPSLKELPRSLPILALSRNGPDIRERELGDTAGLLVGMEGPGLPEGWEEQAVSIPIRDGVESLNASVAAGIALFLWSAAGKRS